jgi:hypothetical protein
MVWFLLICNFNGVCTWSPPLKNLQECQWLQQETKEMRSDAVRTVRAKCIGISVDKPK